MSSEYIIRYAVGYVDEVESTYDLTEFDSETNATDHALLLSRADPGRWVLVIQRYYIHAAAVALAGRNLIEYDDDELFGILEEKRCNHDGPGLAPWWLDYDDDGKTKT